MTRCASRAPRGDKTDPPRARARARELSMKRTFKGAVVAGVAAVALFAGLAATEAGSLKIESWRNDDADIWNSKIIPAFNKHYPDIKIEFAPSAPKEYNAALNARLDGGTAGDLITCRPFDASLALYQKHQLDGLNDLKGMDNFSDVAKSAWQTDEARRRSASRSPPSSTASSTTRKPSPRSAPPSRRRSTNSMPCSRN